MRLKDKVAVITGSGTGLGRAAALLFAAEGASVVVADVSTVSGRETVKLIKDAGGNAIFCRVDVSKAADCQRMVKTAVDRWGKLDIMYNNAGISGGFASVVDTTEELWNRILSVNLTGVLLGTKYAIPQMLKQGGGAIVNTASTAGKTPAAGTAAYGVSKAGVIHLTKVTALEHAKNNIRCNCVLPFAMDTPFYSQMPEEQKKALLKSIIAASPSGKIPQPEQVARVALFLASDEASFVSGQIVAVDFGARP